MTYLETKPTMRDKRLQIRQWLVGTSCRVTLIALIVVMSVLSIMQTSSLSTKGFEISSLERQIAELERQTQALDVEIATHRSLARVEERLSSMGFVPVGDLRYMTTVGTAVARR